MNRNSISKFLFALCVFCSVEFVASTSTSVSAAEEQPVLSERQSKAFGQICARCHVRPGIGVPILGDTAEWEKRGAKGLEALVANTITGIGGMPPLGTCGFCSEDDFRHLAAFMARLSLKTRAETPSAEHAKP